MNDKKSYILKKYNLSNNDIKDSHIKYYYTTYPELCCKYDLKPISLNVGPFEFNEAISTLNNYYANIKCSYYKDLLIETKKHGNDITKYEPNIADRIIFEYIKFRKNTYCLTLWPYFSNGLSEVIKFLSNYGIVYYVKEISLTYNAALNLIYQLYSDTKRFPTILKLKEKLEYLGWTENEKKTIRVIFFENTSNEVISGSQAQLKTKIRNFLLGFVDNKNLRGDDLVHINDYFYQTIEYSKIFLHKKTLKFLKKQNLTRYFNSDFDNCRLYVNTLKNWIIQNVDHIDYERFVLMGSSVLYAYGIRQCRDIDGLVFIGNGPISTHDLVKKIVDFFYDKRNKMFFASFGLVGTQYWKKQWDEKDVEWFKLLGIKDRDELVFNPDYHFYFNGMKLISLKSEIIRKYVRNNHYDYGDLLMIMKIINTKIKLPKIPNDIKLDEFKRTIKLYLREKPTECIADGLSVLRGEQHPHHLTAVLIMFENFLADEHPHGRNRWRSKPAWRCATPREWL